MKALLSLVFLQFFLLPNFALAALSEFEKDLSELVEDARYEVVCATDPKENNSPSMFAIDLEGPERLGTKHPLQSAIIQTFQYHKKDGAYLPNAGGAQILQRSSIVQRVEGYHPLTTHTLLVGSDAASGNNPVNYSVIIIDSQLVESKKDPNGKVEHSATLSKSPSVGSGRIARLTCPVMKLK